MLFKRDDHRISFIGGLILMALTLAAGVSVYVVMQRQTESILAKNLESSLQNNVRLFDSQINRSLADTLALTPRISLITNLHLHAAEPANAQAIYELQRRIDLIKATGFEGVSIYDAAHNLIVQAGRFAQRPTLRVALHSPQRIFLLWDQGFILQISADILDSQNQRLGSVITETRLPQLMHAISDIKVIGQSAELAVCSPDDQWMYCFPLSPSLAKFTHIARIQGGKALPMHYALEGKNGLIFAQDYRREPVVAAYAPIGSLGLGMVLKIDQAELYLPVIAQLKFIIPLLAVMLLLGVLLLRWLLVPLVRKLFQSEQEKITSNRQLYDLEERWRFALESTGAGVWDFNVTTDHILLSKQCKQMLGFAEDEIGTSMKEWGELIHPDDFPNLLTARQLILSKQEQYFTNEHRKRCKDGSWKWIQVRGMVVSRDDDHMPLRVIGTYIDISARKASEQRILHLASHDNLTGLPNRDLLRDRVQQVIIQAQRGNKLAALLFIDLDQFKTINDSLGHDIGDLLLQEVAQRLVTSVRTEDTVARQGGDEFIVLLLSISDAQHAGLLAQKLLDDLILPHQIRDKELHISASIGIAVFPDDGEDVDTLLKNSDIAMYHAKQVGRNNYQFFTPKMNQLAAERHALSTDLRHAISRNELLLHFQPIVDLHSNKLVGVEALLRWQHPEQGLILPLNFISLAEETGLIMPIGEWVVETACAQLKAWQSQGYDVPRMAINLSAKQFRQKTLAPFIAHILQKTGLSAGALEMEMTESLLMENTDEVAENLKQLAALGLRISIDDFGTGYSSLSYLKRFTINTLKIDRSFVMDIATDPDDATIVTAIIALAHSLQMKVIAEGVENAAQLDFLRQHNCDQYQGIYFSPALSVAEMHTLLLRNQAASPVFAQEKPSSAESR